MDTTTPRTGTDDERRARRRSAGADDGPGSGPHADPESVARTILLDRLSAQPRTRAELADTLARKLVPPEVAQRLLDRFEEVGLVDDAAFARSWVESRQTGRGLARRALAQELRRKGVADEVAREALEEIDADDEVEAARHLVRRRLRTMSRLDRRTRMRRLVAMLARKGYPSGVALSVVRDELGDELGDDGDDGDGTQEVPERW
ncbi:MAG: recombination regulator RecX [Actinomycetota bacterium]|nr:recombination regulator RecX [Actinomycetota bacterium]